MVPNSFEFDFEQISLNPVESPHRKIFQYDRHQDLNYFNEINISSKESTYINETDIKVVPNETQRFLFF